MPLSGTLREFKIPDILQLISLQKKSGILTFNNGEGTIITIIFEEGNIVGVDAFPKKLEMRVGSVLVKQGKISEEMLQRALNIQRRTGQKIGEILVSMGLSESIIPEALKVHALQIILSLFNWRKGEYSFNIYETIKAEMKTLPPISVDNVIMEGVQMLDEWPVIRRSISNDNVVFEPVFLSKRIEIVSEFDDFDESDAENVVYLTENEFQLLKMINGQKSVKDLVELGLYTEYRLYKGLYNLQKKGLIQEKRRDERIFVEQESEREVRSSFIRIMSIIITLLLLMIFILSFRDPFPLFKIDQNNTFSQVELPSGDNDLQISD